MHHLAHLAHKAHELLEDAELALHLLLEAGHLAHLVKHLFH